MPEQSRQLAAIMFTDIVGYTKLMGEDEAKAMAAIVKRAAEYAGIRKRVTPHNPKAQFCYPSVGARD